MYQQNYDLPETKEVILDRSTNEVKEKAELTPFDIIRTTAEASGHTINNPKPSCSKCHGRGYIGIDKDHGPMPCNCIFPPTTANEKAMQDEYDRQHFGQRDHLNREQRRKLRKQFRSMVKRNPKAFVKHYEDTHNE